MSWSKGEWAEDYVAKRLIANGWTVTARNYRRRGFELDIIARNSQRLLCIEVKGRRSERHMDPSLLLNPRKIQRLHQGMSYWLQDSGRDEWRNTEFWLCIVTLSETAKEEGVHWMRLDGSWSEDN